MTPREVKDLLTDICSMIVTKPTVLIVKLTEEPPTCTFSISASGADVGKLIGKGGGHWRSLEVLLTAWGKANGFFPFLNKIGRLDDLESEPYRRYQARPDWPHEKVLDLVHRMGAAVFGGANIVDVTAADEGEYSDVRIILDGKSDAGLIRDVLPSFNSIIRAIGSSIDRSMSCKITQAHVS